MEVDDVEDNESGYGISTGMSTVDVGAKVQSIPGPDEQPQTFETTEPIAARVEWNALGAKVSFNPELSEGRYELVNSLYDRVVTFRLKDAPGNAILLTVVESGFDKVPPQRRRKRRSLDRNCGRQQRRQPAASGHWQWRRRQRLNFGGFWRCGGSIVHLVFQLPQ